MTAHHHLIAHPRLKLPKVHRKAAQGFRLLSKMNVRFEYLFENDKRAQKEIPSEV